MNGAIPPLPHMPTYCALGLHLYFNPLYPNQCTGGSSVMFKSQPTFHLIFFTPYLHYAPLLSFNPCIQVNRKRYCQIYRWREPHGIWMAQWMTVLKQFMQTSSRTMRYF